MNTERLKYECKLAGVTALCHILQHKIPYLIKAGCQNGVRGLATELVYSATRWGTGYVFDRVYSLCNNKGDIR